MKTRRSKIAFLFALAALSAGAFAADAGRIQIGPDTTPGDGSYLYKITQPGSYYLGANIVGVAGQGGIRITAADVTLDLNGFAVIGPGHTTGQSGIFADSIQGPVHIYNGSVRNWRDVGVLVRRASARLDSLNASDNGAFGFDVGGNSTASLTNCVAEENGATGFLLLSASPHPMTLENCAAHGNDGGGFEATHATLRGCTALSNGGAGFTVYFGMLVQCLSAYNKGDGINTSDSSVQECNSHNNEKNGIRATVGSVQRCRVTSNALSGIVAENSVLVVGNQVFSHRTAGFMVNAGILVQMTGSRIEGNNLTYNSQGIRVLDPDNIIVGNTARNTTNYFIVAGNRVGTIVVPPLSGAINGNSGAAGTGATDPWSNIAY